MNRRTKAATYVGIGLLFAFSLAYQWRSSIETITDQQTYDFFVPFTVQRFTNRVDALSGGLTTAGLHRGDELIAVNGHAFQGASWYLRALWQTQNKRAEVQIPPGLRPPLVITARSGSSPARSMQVDFPHCTCGVPTTSRAVQMWLLPPMFCVLLAFTIVLLRPTAMLSWIFLALLLSLSQLTLVPEWVPDFQVTVNPMRWAGWMRVPSVVYRSFFQNVWPGALLLFAGYFFFQDGNVLQRARWCAAPLLGYAAIQCLLAVAWSEDDVPFAALYRSFWHYSTETTLGAFAAVIVFGFSVRRACGFGIAAFAAVALWALYWPGARVLKVQVVNDLNAFRLETEVLPAAFIFPAFAAACFILVTVFQRRSLDRIDELSMGFLALPLVYLLILTARIWSWWQSPSTNVSLVSAALGLIGLASALLRRTRRAQCPPASFP